MTYITNLESTLRKKCPYSELLWSEYGKIRIRITPNTDTFHAVLPWIFFWKCSQILQQSYAEHMRMAVAKMNVLSVNILEIIFNNPIKAYVTII